MLFHNVKLLQTSPQLFPWQYLCVPFLYDAVCDIIKKKKKKEAFVTPDIDSIY